MEGFFPQHRRHGLSQGLEGGVTEHGELEFAVAVHKIRVGEEIQPVAHVLVEGPEQPFALEGAALQHLLRLDAPAVAELVDQQVAHLPAVPHLLRHHAAQRLPVVFGGRGLEQPPLLFNGSELGVALVDDQVHQGVAHALVGNVDHPAPLRPALVMPKFDLVRAHGPELGFKFVARDLRIGHVDVPLPFAEQVHPIIEVRYARCRHGYPCLSGSYLA